VEIMIDTREAALKERQDVFILIAQEYRDRGQALPRDTTEIVHAIARLRATFNALRLPSVSQDVARLAAMNARRTRTADQ
jgi:hypothetical protein